MRNILNPNFPVKKVFLGVGARNTPKIFIRPFSFLSAKGELAGGSAKRRAFTKSAQNPIKNIICHPE